MATSTTELSKRAGTKWSEQEDAELVRRAKEGLSLEKIAEEHQRSVKGVKYRLISHAVNLMRDEDLTMEEAGKRMGGIFAKDIESFMKEQEQKKLNGRRAMNGEPSPTAAPIAANDELMDVIRDIRDLLRTIVAKNKK